MNLIADQFKNIFEYEISPIPQSLFDENGLRKNEKSQLYEFFSKTNENLRDKTKFAYIIEGGMLLHQTKWVKGTKFSIMAQNYVNYIIRVYGESVFVVFDGYGTDTITSWERK